MFSRAFIVAIFVGLIGLQSASASTDYEMQERITITEIIDKIKQVADKLEELVSGTLDKALETLKDLLNKLQALKDEWIAKGKQLIEEKLQEVQKTIEYWQEQAAKVGVSIEECIEGKQEEIKAIAKKLENELISCVTDKINEGIKMVQDDIKYITDTITTISSVPSDISKCIPSGHAIKCLTELLGKLSSLVVNVPIKVTQMITDAQAYVNGLPASLGICAADKALAAAIEAGKLSVVIGQCAADKISSASSTTVAY